MNAVRIGRVKLKSGGEVHLLPSPISNNSHTNTDIQWLLNASQAGELAQVALVGVRRDGSIMHCRSCNGGPNASVWHLLGAMTDAMADWRNIAD